MGKPDKRIDEYIAKIPGFAKPVLRHLRKQIHKTCPGVEENIKWGAPSFEYKGMLCGFAAFKNHAAFWFWKAALMKDHSVLLGRESKTAMGNLGKITSVKDLPIDSQLNKWIKEAKKLNDDGVKLDKKINPKHSKKEYKIPLYFKKELDKNKAAKNTYDNFSPSHKREYLEWITEAKTGETRMRRMKTAIEWLNEGKSRNWKYKNC